MKDMNPSNSQSSIVNSQSQCAPFRPFQTGDLVRIRKVNGCLPCGGVFSKPINRETIGELGEKTVGNTFAVFFDLYDTEEVDSAYLELVAPAEENGGRFFLHHSINYKDSRYEIYHGAFSNATLVCSLSDKYYTKEKAEEEIAKLRALHQQPAKEN